MKFYFGKGSESGKYHLHRLIHAEGEGGGQGNEEKWFKDLPEDMRAWEEVTKAETKEDFYKWVGEARSHLGSSIRVPGEDAGKEDWAAFNDKLIKKVPTLMHSPNPEDDESMKQVFKSLGHPEKADDYTYGEHEGINKEAADSFKAIAHPLGLTAKQYDGVVEGMTKAQNEARDAAELFHKESHEALSKEWGADYNRRMSVATTIAKLTDAPENVQKLLEEGKADVESYKWLFSVAQKFKGEGSNLADDKNAEKVAMSPEEAATKIAEIRGNKQHPFFNKTDPGHEIAKKKMEELYKMKFPEG